MKKNSWFLLLLSRLLNKHNSCMNQQQHTCLSSYCHSFSLALKFHLYLSLHVRMCHTRHKINLTAYVRDRVQYKRIL